MPKNHGKLSYGFPGMFFNHPLPLFSGSSSTSPATGSGRWAGGGTEGGAVSAVSAASGACAGAGGDGSRDRFFGTGGGWHGGWHGMCLEGEGKRWWWIGEGDEGRIFMKLWVNNGGSLICRSEKWGGLRDWERTPRWFRVMSLHNKLYDKWPQLQNLKLSIPYRNITWALNKTLVGWVI